MERILTESIEKNSGVTLLSLNNRICRFIPTDSILMSKRRICYLTYLTTIFYFYTPCKRLKTPVSWLF